MMSGNRRPRILILSNPEKPDAIPALERLAAFAQPRAELIGTVPSLDVSSAIAARPDRIIVLGGDGTLIGVARSLGATPFPLVGVNMGKLGFLAEFSLDELCEQFDRVMTDDACVSRRLTLEVTLTTKKAQHALPAINDCVIQMGPPFRMIALDVYIDGERLTHLRGDGLAVCTPTGSTAHSLSAGGPVMAAELRAIGVTPLNAHSLTHRPIVVGPDATIEVRPVAVNSGSSVIVDGQTAMPLHEGDVLRIRRFPADFLLVRNPSLSPWDNLVRKLHWGQSP
ncbi:MAG: NAD kinase [Phycisphaerae bacterium]|nr:NAD kinase [Phycisphaerae bacterium]